jgi:CRP-like cAMP-binding protein
MKLQDQQMKDIIEMLQKTPIWSGLSTKELAHIVERSKQRRFESDDIIVRKGDMGLGFYLILEGTVDVRAEGKGLSKLVRGSFFGEMSLLDDQPRSADVVALEPTSCLVLNVFSFKSLIADNPKIALKLMQESVRRIRATNQALSE